MAVRIPYRFGIALFSAALVCQAAVNHVLAVGTEDRQDDFPAIAAGPDGSIWMAWQSYGDRTDDIRIRRNQNGVWGNLQVVPGTAGDVSMPQLSVDRQNRLWIVWAEQRSGNWDLYCRS